MKSFLWFAVCCSVFAVNQPLLSQDADEKTANEYKSEIRKIELDDGETLTGKLYLPDLESINELVIFVHGTGPGTYLNPRKVGNVEFNYFDMFGERFNDRGVAFFSYNKRGVEIGDKPPMFDEVDRDKFKKVVPHVEINDLGTVIESLSADERFANANVILFGWSEGTIIASAVAEDESNGVDGLFLAGYAHENMFDIIKWQFSGVSSMINLNPIFDANEDGSISKEEYESEEKKPARFRAAAMGGATFELLDANKDEKMSAADFAMRTEPVYNMLLEKISENDDDWVWENYFRISTDWLHEHFELEPNKSRLLRLDIPIYIFHGTSDPNVSVEGVYDLQKRFDANGKSNLNVFVFEEHDHNLNFMEWALKNTIPEGIEKIFETAAEIAR